MDRTLVGGEGDDLRQSLNMSIPPSPPTVAKTSRPPMYRTGWSSVERITSGSLRLSRASTRTSLASDDLEKYMNVGTGGSLNNIPAAEDLMSGAMIANNKPLPPPRISSSGSVGTSRVLSAGGRNQEVGGGDIPQQSYSVNSTSTSGPPPVKACRHLDNFGSSTPIDFLKYFLQPRKSSSISNLNPTNSDSSSWLSNNHNLSENSMNRFLSPLKINFSIVILFQI